MMQDKKIAKLLRIQIIEPKYSILYLCGSLCMHFNFILFIIGFASPYWLKSNAKDVSSEFINMGLWNVCFSKYKNLQTSGNKNFDGCIWIQSNDLIKLRRWLLPNWLIAIQILESFCICLIAVIMVSILYGLIINKNKIRKKFYYILYITVMLVFLDLLIITCLLLFGINSFFHEWTPENNQNEEENVFIYWSFWIQCISLLLAIIGSINIKEDYYLF
jgi:hypothetical protein